jgi:hypothetical protein
MKAYAYRVLFEAGDRRGTVVVIRALGKRLVVGVIAAEAA